MNMHVHRTMESLRAELLSDMAAHLHALLCEHSIGGRIAEQVGAAFADHIATHWGGLVVTIPKDHAYRLSQREAEILDHYRHGATVRELAETYGMTERGMRRLLARAPRRFVVDNQLDLFGTGEEPANEADDAQNRAGA